MKLLIFASLLMIGCSSKTIRQMGSMKADMASMKGPPPLGYAVKKAKEKMTIKFCGDEPIKMAQYRKAAIAGGFYETGYFDEVLNKFQIQNKCDGIAEAVFFAEDEVTSAQQILNNGHECVTLTGYPVWYVKK